MFHQGVYTVRFVVHAEPVIRVAVMWFMPVAFSHMTPYPMRASASKIAQLLEQVQQAIHVDQRITVLAQAHY